jgi:hypothetical protein
MLLLDHLILLRGIALISLQAVLLLELQVLREESVDTVDHGLDKLHLGVAQAMLVGNVVGDSIVTAGFTASTSRLNLELFATGLQCGQTLLGPAGKVNVDRSPHAGSKIGGAGVEESVLLVEQEVLSGLLLDNIADSLDATGQSVKDAANVTT